MMEKICGKGESVFFVLSRPVHAVCIRLREGDQGNGRVGERGQPDSVVAWHIQHSRTTDSRLAGRQTER